MHIFRVDIAMCLPSPSIWNVSIFCQYC